MDRLGAIWVRELKLPILEVAYEDLVVDPEANARRIVDFLGLPWEAGCLDFQNTQRAVDHAQQLAGSPALYSSAIGRWRRYEKHLGPMLATLSQGV